MRPTALFSSKWLVLSLALACASSALAQGSGRHRGMHRGGGSSGGGGDLGETLKRLDSNKDGKLDPAEIPSQARPGIEAAAKQAGLDLSKSQPIQEIERAMRQAQWQNRGGGEHRGGGENRDGEHRERGDDSRRDSDDKKPANNDNGQGFGTASDKKADAISGFGEKVDLPKVPGFDDPKRPLPSYVVSSSSGGGGAAHVPNDSDAKVRKYAEGLLNQYDTDKNGSLDKDEWSKMKGEPEKYDINGDGKITTDEMTQKLLNYGKPQPTATADKKSGGGSGSGGSGSSGPSGSSGSSTASSSSGSSRSGGSSKSRYMTPTDRLPSGLPSWFSRNDANGDGQVTMSEFATTWSDSKSQEFIKYDLNGDGILTPQECLSADKKGSSSSSSSSSDKYGEKSGDKYGDKSGDKSGEKSGDKSGEKYGDKR